jgi:PAS domain S-box-containing protein
VPAPTQPPGQSEQGAYAPRADAGDAPPAEALTLEQLHTALEELHVTEEELRSQNEALTEARNAVEAERARYRALFEFAPDAYLVTTPEGTIIEANHSAGELLRVRPDRLAGKPLAVFFPRDKRRELRTRLNLLSTGQQRADWEARLLRRNGGDFEALITLGAERDAAAGWSRCAGWCAT